VTRFLLDMGIAQSTGHYLTSRGHDVVHLSEQGLERLPDDRIVSKAKEEERTIVTHDLDFGRIVALSGRSVPSIVTLRLADMTPKHVNTALETVLREAMLSLERGALVTITESGIRIRDLPIDAD
jgi:predicted nuclease of predicted toxin-antitoxin system